MKNQALFSFKDKSKKLKCHLQFLSGTLRVNLHFFCGYLMLEIYYIFKFNCFSFWHFKY